MEVKEYLRGVTDIHISLYPSSWGRLQCNVVTYDDKEYHSWAGRAEQPLTKEMLIDALDLIEIQLKEV